jgi:ABC-type transport system substrate-binding protein
LIPGLSTSYYDLAVTSELFNSLSMRNDTVMKTMLPSLADGTVASPGWSVDSSGKIWTVHIRAGVKWHDGVCCLNATDVKFTFDSLQDPGLAAPVESFINGIVGGKNNVTIVDPLTVKFTLPTPYAYFVENILTAGIVPYHILHSRPYNSTTGVDWLHSAFNTGVNPSASDPAPIGTGPYKWVGYDTTTATVHLTRNDNYFDFPYRGKADLVAKGEFTVKDYYVKNIIGSDAAITALKNGEVNVLDNNYNLGNTPSFLADWGSNYLATYDGFGDQEMGVNMQHPVIGTGVQTPACQANSGCRTGSNPTLAQSYATDIRKAISYATPRTQIVNSLLSGYGIPAITTPVVGNSATKTALTEGFNTDLQPYPFNLTLAKQELQAAGYTLPTVSGGCGPTAGSCLTPNLHIVLLVPTSNSARRAWASLIQSQLLSIGMDVGKVELPFSPNIFDRALTPPVANLGKTFDQGGFDILFVGYNLGIDADPWSLYDSTQFAPTGSNYYLWTNSTNDNLVRQIKSTVDKPTRLNLVKQWQVLANDALPSIPLHYTREIVAFDKSIINGKAILTAFNGPAWPNVELLNVGATSQPTNFLTQYGVYIAAGVIAAAAVIIGGLFFMRRRKRIVRTGYTAPGTGTAPPTSAPSPPP